ncbi:MAG: hypothetical protein UW68_C0021G0022 [Candidatus Collierbacteria bacterium GW2011_GWB1_44_6]|uniref:Uncharacterized protein n=2 Tax=Candidatus Collieribacteriota TaxID=1752725 RepID=A0A0G1MLM9_9BACT|nr:MAG: hypothetical protein UV68_C0026G0022 [Candidatus Collierbacteria bacterium GW2011_GWC2_43_12]KKT72929.1 MAG: hypothetical protein UW68_C0021G0022 [Candidatus Collierbacteria bacterium GW2011_GWB1_44_6]KKT83049.1 MAG: hypothetical protein UW80_C0023G0007 [Microgenomates group bacterium GW2011_GWC1_44_9]
MKNIISQVFAADIDVGTGITGTGPFQVVMDQGATKTALGDFLSNIITTITVVGGLAFVIYFFIGSLKWITAGGDKTKVSEAQQQMTQAAIGLIAIVASFFIVGIVGAVLGIDILNPFETLF